MFSDSYIGNNLPDSELLFRFLLTGR